MGGIPQSTFYTTSEAEQLIGNGICTTPMAANKIEEVFDDDWGTFEDRADWKLRSAGDADSVTKCLKI